MKGSGQLAICAADDDGGDDERQRVGDGEGIKQAVRPEEAEGRAPRRRQFREAAKSGLRPALCRVVNDVIQRRDQKRDDAGHGVFAHERARLFIFQKSICFLFQGKDLLFF